MGKSQSKSDDGEVYLVRPLPVAYDLHSTRAEPLSPSQSVIVLHPSTKRKSLRRAHSLHSVSDHSNKMAATMSRWKSASSRKDVLDRKAYFLGRYQTKAITESTLEALRQSLRQAKRRKTRVRMSPLGFYFGSKPGGLLTSDKVAYRFVPLESIESLRLDTKLHDVLLCIVRIEDGDIQNGHVDTAVVQHYEIDAFHLDPRDAVLFQRAHSEFKLKGINFHQQMAERDATANVTTTLRTRAISDQHISDGWITARNNGFRTLVTPARSDKDLRARPYSGSAYRRASLDDDHLEARNLHRRRRPTRDVATDPRYPVTSDDVRLTPSVGYSMATRVFFHRDIPMADVECQISEGAVLLDSYDRSRTSSQSTARTNSERSHTRRKDSVRRRMRNLSREMDQLRSMLDSSDEECPVSNGHIPDSGSGKTQGRAIRLNTPSNQQNLAGTIDTRLGKVDVIVDQPPVDTRRQTYNQDGYTSDVFTSSRHRRDVDVRRQTSDRTHVSTEVAGRYVFYRPVTSELRTTHSLSQPAYVTPTSRQRWTLK